MVRRGIIGRECAPQCRRALRVVPSHGSCRSVGPPADDRHDEHPQSHARAHNRPTTAVYDAARSLAPHTRPQPERSTTPAARSRRLQACGDRSAHRSCRRGVLGLTGGGRFGRDCFISGCTSNRRGPNGSYHSPAHGSQHTVAMPRRRDGCKRMNCSAKWQRESGSTDGR